MEYQHFSCAFDYAKNTLLNILNCPTNNTAHKERIRILKLVTNTIETLGINVVQNKTQEKTNVDRT